MKQHKTDQMIEAIHAARRRQASHRKQTDRLMERMTHGFGRHALGLWYLATAAVAAAVMASSFSIADAPDGRDMAYTANTSRSEMLQFTNQSVAQLCGVIE